MGVGWKSYCHSRQIRDSVDFLPEFATKVSKFLVKNVKANDLLLDFCDKCSNGEGSLHDPRNLPYFLVKNHKKLSLWGKKTYINFSSMSRSCSAYT